MIRQNKHNNNEMGWRGFKTHWTQKHTPTHTWTTQQKRLRTSKPSPSVFIMWRASCFPVTLSLLFVHWKPGVEMGKKLGGILRRHYPSKKYASQQVTFDVMPRESGVVKSPFSEKEKKQRFSADLRLNPPTVLSCCYFQFSLRNQRTE